MKNKSPLLTFLLMLICIGVAIVSDFGKVHQIVRQFYIIDPHHSVFDAQKIQWWRLFSPIFLHFSFLHLLSNMMGLYDFGARIEKKNGSLFFGIILVIIASTSNLVQYKVTHSFAFGGMSGIDYGLFGYMWIYNHNRPSLGYEIPQFAVVVMCIWFLVCLTGIFPIANWTHSIGLLIGSMIAYGHALFDNKRENATLVRDQKEAPSSSSLH
jgi:GlpG protein